jgi:hypothetical protein
VRAIHVHVLADLIFVTNILLEAQQRSASCPLPSSRRQGIFCEIDNVIAAAIEDGLYGIERRAEH